MGQLAYLALLRPTAKMTSPPRIPLEELDKLMDQVQNDGGEVNTAWYSVTVANKLGWPVPEDTMEFHVYLVQIANTQEAYEDAEANATHVSGNFWLYEVADPVFIPGDAVIRAEGAVPSLGGLSQTDILGIVNDRLGVEFPGAPNIYSVDERLKARLLSLFDGILECDANVENFDFLIDEFLIEAGIETTVEDIVADNEQTTARRNM